MNAQLARIACCIGLVTMSVTVGAQELRVAQATSPEPGVKPAVTESATEWRVKLPSRTVGLVIPREDWAMEFQQQTPAGTTSYTMLSSAKRKIQFSFYIDASTVCPSTKSCLTAALKNPSYLTAKDLTMSAVGPFAVAQFYLDAPPELKSYQANVLASAFVDGQWFDLHLSSEDSVRPDMEPLLRLLRQVEIR